MVMRWWGQECGRRRPGRTRDMRRRTKPRQRHLLHECYPLCHLVCYPMCCCSYQPVIKYPVIPCRPLYSIISACCRLSVLYVWRQCSFEWSVDTMQFLSVQVWTKCGHNGDDARCLLSRQRWEHRNGGESLTWEIGWKSKEEEIITEKMAEQGG